MAGGMTVPRDRFSGVRFIGGRSGSRYPDMLRQGCTRQDYAPLGSRWPSSFPAVSSRVLGETGVLGGDMGRTTEVAGMVFEPRGDGGVLVVAHRLL